MGMITGSETKVRLELLQEDNRPLEECVKYWIQNKYSSEAIFLMTLAKVKTEFVAKELLDILNDYISTYNCVDIVYTELEEKFKSKEKNIPIEAMAFIYNLVKDSSFDDEDTKDFTINSDWICEYTLYYCDEDKVIKQLKDLKVIIDEETKQRKELGSIFDVTDYKVDCKRFIEVYNKIIG